MVLYLLVAAYTIYGKLRILYWDVRWLDGPLRVHIRKVCILIYWSTCSVSGYLLIMPNASLFQHCKPHPQAVSTYTGLVLQLGCQSSYLCSWPHRLPWPSGCLLTPWQLSTGARHMHSHFMQLHGLHLSANSKNTATALLVYLYMSYLTRCCKWFCISLVHTELLPTSIIKYRAVQTRNGQVLWL